MQWEGREGPNDFPSPRRFLAFFEKGLAMDELVALVSQKTGLPPEQAKTAVVTVLNFLKDRLPAPIASQIDGVLEGKSAGGLADQIGGMFGGKS